MLQLTEKARQKALSIAKEQELNPLIRVGVKGSGCSGYQHDMFFEEENKIRETDHVFEFDGVRLVVDMMSMTYIEGTTIDYIDGLMGTGFKFLNPKAKTTCGCGSSFKV